MINRDNDGQPIALDYNGVILEKGDRVSVFDFAHTMEHGTECHFVGLTDCGCIISKRIDNGNQRIDRYCIKLK